MPGGDFVWRHQTEYFNAQTYLSFVDEELLPHFYRRRHRVYLIQDNAEMDPKKLLSNFGQSRAPQDATDRVPHTGEAG